MLELDRIYHVGCLEGLRKLPDKSVDLVVTDPPYNVGLRYSLYDDNKENYKLWCSAWLYELLRVCRGAVLISVGLGNMSMWTNIKAPKWWLCWNKGGSASRNCIGFNGWEPIGVYGNLKQISTVDYIYAPIKIRGDVGSHPCPKPIAWAKEQIIRFSQPGGVVLDPFMGTGTTAIACKDTGRKYIGFEIDAEYISISERRLSNRIEQKVLRVEE